MATLPNEWWTVTGGGGAGGRRRGDGRGRRGRRGGGVAGGRVSRRVSRRQRQRRRLGLELDVLGEQVQAGDAQLERRRVQHLHGHLAPVALHPLEVCSGPRNRKINSVQTR